MNIQFHYGDGVLTLPAALEAILPRADDVALRVLLLLAIHAHDDLTLPQIAKEIGCTLSQAENAVSFWHGTGLLSPGATTSVSEPVKSKKSRAKASAKSPENATAPAANEKGPTPSQEHATSPSPQVLVKTSATALPAYTTEELAAVLERRRELTGLIDECSRVFGKIFNTHEVSQLIGLSDYLGLEDEYLLLVLAHCVKIGKKSLRYAVNTAIALYDDGITDTTSLQQCLKAREEKEEAEGRLRTMFGLGSRALTGKEKKMVETWLTVHHFSTDVIRLAYERTVNATGKPSIPYANSILERWAAAGLTDAAQIQEAEAQYSKQTQHHETPVAGNSFDTNDFFDAALQRSFGDHYVPGQGES